jgi:hypothetical protein
VARQSFSAVPSMVNVWQVVFPVQALALLAHVVMQKRA